MSDEQPTRPIPEGDPPSADPSSLKGLTMALGIGPAESGQDPLLGHDIGGVRIVRLIAEGGMGRVYEGKQEKPNRTVAVKVMRPGLTSPSILKRFEYEAEVLGRLQHPGIAHIYSVGMHQMGKASVPYFVMEYIADARTLTKYAADLKLPTRQRLDLFRSVCDAVAHGHQKGVIHRDLKPSNILVDATGQPKVIDFGVARATDADMALTTMQTDVGQLIGTLQYMSPEQFKADPNDIDVRSDVYALGVILYELLAGKMPYDVKKKAIHEVARIVQEDDPTPLSAFNRALKGDVGVIAGKCLEKDRVRRYSSAGELGADLGRYLTGEPISASPPGFVDGLVRLAKKHRAAAAAVGAVLASLVLGVIGISYFAFEASVARETAIRERDRAETNAQDARDKAVEADLQRKNAETQAAKAVAQEKLATQAAEEARKRLYVATLYRLSQLIATNDTPGAIKVFRDAVTLYEAQRSPSEPSASGAYPTSIPDIPSRDDGSTQHLSILTQNLPFELKELYARMDAAILVLRSPSGIGCFAYNADGSRVSTGSYDGRLQIWDTRRGTVTLERRSHTSAISSLTYSSDGKTLVTASVDKTAKIWDAATGDELQTLRGHTSGIKSVTFSPDGHYVATASQDKTVRIWDVKTGRERRCLKGHEEPVHAVVFSSDGTRVATAAEHHIPRLWDVETGKELAKLEGHYGRITAIVFSPDGKTLGTVSAMNAQRSYDESMRFWDGLTGKQLRSVKPCQNASIRYSPDGKRFVTTGGDGVIWDADTAKILVTLRGHTQRVYMATFSPDGKRVATAAADNTVRVWDAASGDAIAVLRGHAGRVYRAAFSTDGRQLASLSSDGSVRLWDVGMGVTNRVCHGNGGWIFSLAFSPDAGRLVTGFWNRTACIWDTTTCTALATLKGHRWDIEGVAFSSDGSKVATASVDKTAKLWDAYTGSELHTLIGHAAVLNAVTFNPDGTAVATASGDKTARLWDASDGQQRVELKGHKGSLRAVAYSPSGRRVVTGADDCEARIWDVTTGDCVAELKGHAATIWSVAYSSDGSLVATASEDSTARIWDAETGRALQVLRGHAGCVRGVSFDPSGTRVVTGSLDNTCRVWNALTGDELLVIEGDIRQVAALRFSPDGQTVASGGGDGAATMWGLTNAARYAARLKGEDIQAQLAPQVDRWCAGGARNALEELKKTKATMNSEQYQEAVKMVLRRLAGTKN